jgi:hypothetical protein
MNDKRVCFTDEWVKKGLHAEAINLEADEQALVVSVQPH